MDNCMQNMDWVHQDIKTKLILDGIVFCFADVFVQFCLLHFIQCDLDCPV